MSCIGSIAMPACGLNCGDRGLNWGGRGLNCGGGGPNCGGGGLNCGGGGVNCDGPAGCRWRGRGDGPLPARGQAGEQLCVVSRLLLRVQQAELRHGDFAQQLLAYFALRPRLVRANPQRLPVGRLLDHFRTGLEEHDPQQAVEIYRPFMGRNPQPIEVWIK